MNKSTVFKVFGYALIILCAIVLLELMISSGDAREVYETYDSVKVESTAGTSKKLLFLQEYTKMTGDTTLAIARGVDQNTANKWANPEEPSGGTPGSWDSSNHNHYAIKQGNYANVPLGIDNVSNNGCGLCSLIAATAELSGVTFEPQDFINTFPSTVATGWQNGTSNNFYMSGVSAFATEATASSAVPGTYSASVKVSGNGSYSDELTKSCIDAIIANCGDENKVAIISTSGNGDWETSDGLFTGGGHIICVTDIITESDGTISMHLSDSSGVSAKLLGKEWREMANVNIPIKSADGDYITTATVSYGGTIQQRHYWIKYVTILERTD